jgi:uncharacterized protein YjbJ (UPF0337 family)
MFKFGRGKQDPFKSKWQVLTLEVRKRWGMLTDDDIDQIGGDRAILADRLRARYGLTAEQAEQQISEWADRLNLN